MSRQSIRFHGAEEEHDRSGESGEGRPDREADLDDSAREVAVGHGTGLMIAQGGGRGDCLKLRAALGR
jgi:hypothetical protein